MLTPRPPSDAAAARPWRRGTALALGVLGALAGLGAPGCDTPELKVTLADPRGLRAGAAYAEFLVFRDGCPSQEELVDRSFPEPMVDQRLEVDGEFDTLGTVDAQRYGFAALLRTDDCGVLGVGCVEADLADRLDSVLIPLEGLYPPPGACPGTCVDGRCGGDDD